MNSKAIVILAIYLLTEISTTSFASEKLSQTEIANSADERKIEAGQASDRLREHLSKKMNSKEFDVDKMICIDYGFFLQKNASNRIFDADLIMTASISNDDFYPPTTRQKFSAAIIYSAAKRDLDDAIKQVDNCFINGRPFK